MPFGRANKEEDGLMRQALIRAVVTVVALATYTGLASADPGDTISINPGGPITATAMGTVSLGGLINCTPLTMTGVTNTTTIQGAGPLTPIGAVTGVTASNCGAGNSWTFLDTRNWIISMSLSGITYAADRVTVTSMEVTIRTVQVQARVLGGLATCLFMGDLVGHYSSSRGTLTFSAPLSRISGGPLCPDPGHFAGYRVFNPVLRVAIRP